jgi:hypothetical protein
MYQPEHVHRLWGMLSEHLTIPHRFICITDNADGLECETYPMWKMEGFENYPSFLPNCFARLFIFSKEAKSIFGDKVLSIDLDCIITANIDSLITDDSFKICKGYSAPYNGSMYQVRPGEHPEVWDSLSRKAHKMAQKQHAREGVQHYGSDQAWLSHMLPNYPMWYTPDGVYSYSKHINGDKVPDDAKIIFFAGNLKPWGSSLAKLYWGK